MPESHQDLRMELEWGRGLRFPRFRQPALENVWAGGVYRQYWGVGTDEGL